MNCLLILCSFLAIAIAAPPAFFALPKAARFGPTEVKECTTNADCEAGRQCFFTHAPPNIRGYMCLKVDQPYTKCETDADCTDGKKCLEERQKPLTMSFMICKN